MMTPTSCQYPNETADNNCSNTDARACNNNTVASFNWAKLTDQEKEMFYKFDEKLANDDNEK